jgi:hypothetical protein
LDRHSRALPLFEKGLATLRALLGDGHPRTGDAHNHLAFCLHALGRHAEATRHWRASLAGHEAARLDAADSGFERARFRARALSPRAALAVCLAHLGRPLEAWRHAETDLARGLLDDLPRTEAEGADRAAQQRLARLRQLDALLVSLLAHDRLSPEEQRRRDALAGERRKLLDELAKEAARRVAGRVWSLERIQKQIPADAALVLWLDVRSEH